MLLTAKHLIESILLRLSLITRLNAPPMIDTDLAVMVERTAEFTPSSPPPFFWDALASRVIFNASIRASSRTLAIDDAGEESPALYSQLESREFRGTGEVISVCDRLRLGDSSICSCCLGIMAPAVASFVCLDLDTFWRFRPETLDFDWAPVSLSCCSASSAANLSSLICQATVQASTRTEL